MAVQHIILLVINIVGGAAVIGSYIYGLSAQSGGANVLWGGISPSVRSVYFASMIISALAFFAFLYYLFFRLNPAEVVIAGRFNFSLFYLIFIFMLIPSALWMPLTNLYVANAGAGLWIGIRTVLIVVGLASIALCWAILNIQDKVPGVSYWLAVVGSGYFAFHTFILDGIVWAALFRQ